MYDCFNRNITYLRLSVTDRCNYSCSYCMPFRPKQLLREDCVLTLAEIRSVIEAAASVGISKIRLTGGEPLVRPDIVEITKTIAQSGLFSDFGLTTNGHHLNNLAKPLADAGLMRINISLDSIDPERFRQITRFGTLSPVLEGIEAAKVAGLAPIKINCVIQDSVFEKDAQGVAAYCRQNKLEVRFIRQMDLAGGTFSKVIGGEGGDCQHCNRLRITANGIVKPCLFSETGYSIRQFGAAEALRMAIGNKPQQGSVNTRQTFYGIGG